MGGSGRFILSGASEIRVVGIRSLILPSDKDPASRAPLAERAAVNRQVLGSIPSGGAIYPPVAQLVEQRTVKCSRSDPLVGSSNLPWRTIFLKVSMSTHPVHPAAGARPTPPSHPRTYFQVLLLLSYGHTRVNAPHPIRTAKLSTLGPNQYYGRGLRGNLRCCMAHFWINKIFFFVVG